jgi:hypothetical protein
LDGPSRRTHTHSHSTLSVKLMKWCSDGVEHQGAGEELRVHSSVGQRAALVSPLSDLEASPPEPFLSLSRRWCLCSRRTRPPRQPPWAPRTTCACRCPHTARRCFWAGCRAHSRRRSCKSWWCRSARAPRCGCRYEVGPEREREQSNPLCEVYSRERC